MPIFSFIGYTRTELFGKESIRKFNERVGWIVDTLDCCRKILQPNVFKFIFLCNSRYLIYLSNKNHKDYWFWVYQQCRTNRIDTDKNKFLSFNCVSGKSNTLNFPLKSYLLIYWLLFQTLTSTADSSVVIMQP